MLEHQNLQINQQNEQIQAGKQEFAPDMQDLKLEFKKERAASYIDYKKSANTSLDTAELGSTSFKSKTDYQKQRNTNIRRALNLTKSATAYTLEVHDQLTDLNQKLASEMPDNARIFAILENTEFTPQMMYSNNIRLHLREYVTLVRYYRQLPSAESFPEGEEKERKKALDKILKPFSKRVEAFCLSNKIELDGSVKNKNHRTPKMTEADYKGFFNSTINSINENKAKYDPSNCDMSLDEIEKALEMKSDLGDAEIKTPAEYNTTSDRVASLQIIYQQYRVLKDRADSALKEYADVEEKRNANLSAEKKAAYRELHRLAFSYQALFITAYREAKYLEAREKGSENAAELKTKAQKAYNDLQALFDRQKKEEIGKSAPYGISHSIMKLSRTDAMQSDSVRKSQNSRVELHNLNFRLMSARLALKQQHGLSRAKKKELSDLKKVTEAVQKYCNSPREKVGYTAETNVLKDALRTLNSFSRRYPHPDEGISQELDKVKTYFQTMTNGTLDTSRIPENARRLDCRRRRPQNSGDKSRGWKRTAMLETLSYWSDERSTPLFSHEPTVNDLKQRTISNCYMIASVSGLAELSPEYLKSLICDNGDGTVTVKLYDEKQQKPDPELMTNLKEKDYSNGYGKDVADLTKEERTDALINSLQKVNNIFKNIQVNKVDENDDFSEEEYHIDYKDMSPAAYYRMNELLGSVLKCNDISLARKNIERIGEFCPLIKKLLNEGGDEFDRVKNKDALDNAVYEELRRMATSTKDALEIDKYLGNTKRERELDLSGMEEVYVTVDKEVPKIAGTGMTSAGSLWMQLIEKALAFVGRENDEHQHVKGYRSLWYGKDFLKRLTGISGTFENATDEMFERLLQAKDSKTVFTCGSRKETKDLDSGHAYLILGAREEGGKRIVKMRNPYSKGSSTYDYGKDEDKLSNKNKIKFFGSSDDSYGTFEMTWENFRKEFAQITCNNMSSLI